MRFLNQFNSFSQILKFPGQQFPIANSLSFHRPVSSIHLLPAGNNLSPVAPHGPNGVIYIIITTQMKASTKNISTQPANTEARKQLLVVFVGILVTIIASLVLSQNASASNQEENNFTSYDLQTPGKVVKNLQTTFSLISHSTNLSFE
jgi:hypothetical protein